MKSAVSWDTYHKYQASFKILHTVPLSKSMHSCVQECPDKSKSIDSTPLLEQKFFSFCKMKKLWQKNLNWPEVLLFRHVYFSMYWKLNNDPKAEIL